MLDYNLISQDQARQLLDTQPDVTKHPVYGPLCKLILTRPGVFVRLNDQGEPHNAPKEDAEVLRRLLRRHKALPDGWTFHVRSIPSSNDVIIYTENFNEQGDTNHGTKSSKENG